MKSTTFFAIFAVVVALAYAKGERKQRESPFRKMFPQINTEAASGSLFDSNKTGEPLFITPYLEAGKWKEAQVKAKVDASVFGTEVAHVVSYSGYFTVNRKDCNSNMFFWFFPAEYGAKNAPLLLWLQGGPGGSSLFGLFNENGPIEVGAEKVTKRKTSWTTTHNVIYIDNPVGTGFSFTKKDECYAKSETDVANDLYDAMQQFLLLFPNLRGNEFYVSGESYAGKYVPALAHKIHVENGSSKQKINLKGMAIGDGLCDPVTMTNYGDFLFNVGLIDELDRDYFHKVAQAQVGFIMAGKWQEAFLAFDDLLNGDLTGHPSYYHNATGFTSYFNYLRPDMPTELDYYVGTVTRPDVRKAIHVGNLPYNNGTAVETHLLDDVMQSVKPWIEEIIQQNYRVMIYNGQMDVIIAWPLTENFIMSMKWSGSGSYKKMPRTKWHVDGQLAGYAKSVGNFTQVLVRNSGHMVPYDQPKWAFDLINRFTRGKKFD